MSYGIAVSFINSLQGASQEDIGNMARYFADAFPEFQDQIDSARQPVSQPSRTMPHVVRGMIAALLRSTQPSKQPFTCSLEAQEDRALTGAFDTIGRMSEKQWNRLATLNNRDPKDIRRDVWSRIVTHLRMHD